MPAVTGSSRLRKDGCLLVSVKIVLVYQPPLKLYSCYRKVEDVFLESSWVDLCQLLVHRGQGHETGTQAWRSQGDF